MAQSKRRRRSAFLDDYHLDEPALLKADRKAGKPAIYSGFAEDGDPILLKVWHRQSDAQDRDLQEIWHHEVRQLHRLGGYPDAGEIIAPLHQTSFDNQGFYLVLKPGQRRPVGVILERGSPGHWLRNPRMPGNRVRLWRNLSRVAIGLETLHAQGLLHRNLDLWSILTTGGDEPDFQLTGFEWSLRIVGAAATLKGVRKSEAPNEPASFLLDWKAFGALAAGLMGIDHAKLANPTISASNVSESVTTEEVRLLRNLIQAEKLDRLDGDVVRNRIKDIVRGLEAEIAGRDPKLHVAVRLGVGSPLSEQLRVGFDGDLEVADVAEQLRIIQNDLGGSPQVLAVKTGGGEGEFRLVLQGTKFRYALNPYLHRRSTETPSWEFAYCERTEATAPAHANLLDSIQLPASSLEVLTAKDAIERFPRLRGKLTNWADLRRRFEQQHTPTSREQRLRQAFALTQCLEVLFAAADVYPVSALDYRAETEDNQHVMAVALRQDPERDALSKALGLLSPALRFQSVLADERRGDEWILTEARQVGTKEITDTAWRYLGEIQLEGQPEAYVFSGQNPAPAVNNPVFIPGDFVGRDIQFQRRLKALKALGEHAELLKMLVDARVRILDTHDKPEKDAAFAELDESKQEALEAIVATLPLFLVQGPPGVGKTRLVRDLVCQTFRQDATGRLLLTAQSNSAVDHLLEELHGALEADGAKAVIVRCRPKDRVEDAGPYEIGAQASKLLQDLSQSAVVEGAPQHLREAVARLANDAGARAWRRAGAGYGKPAFEGLLVRSANVVFATTNSSELERLIEERGQFDWAIVEEAGKATGGELLSPLLLSHRRLMIGDHKQLSPFNSERMIKLLKQPDTVKKALSAGVEFISRALRDPATDEVLEELDEADGEFPALCALAIDCVVLFERLIEAEFKVHERKPTARRIAHRLTQQHRMHPAIARVVSHAFYDDKLKTHKSAENRFSSTECPVRSLDAKKLPDRPLVVVDMPYVQNTVGLKKVEHEPRWHNPAELESVLSVLRLLTPTSAEEKRPSLAILSPYNEQVRRLRKRVDEDLLSFPNLAAFRPAVGPGDYCGTVDSFQGNEADVVVVNLVRNNHHASVRNALGFLSDSRRMNVLLSRARWRMILVGSTKFLAEVLESSKGTDSGAEIAFIERLLEALQTERSAGNAVFIRPDVLAAEAAQ